MKDTKANMKWQQSFEILRVESPVMKIYPPKPS